MSIAVGIVQTKHFNRLNLVHSSTTIPETRLQELCHHGISFSQSLSPSPSSSILCTISSMMLPETWKRDGPDKFHSVDAYHSHLFSAIEYFCDSGLTNVKNINMQKYMTFCHIDFKVFEGNFTMKYLLFTSVSYVN